MSQNRNQDVKKAHTPDSFTNYQAVAFLINSVIGVGVLTLPRVVSEYTGPDGIGSILVAGFISFLILLLISFLTRRFVNQSFVQFAPLILGSKKNKNIGKWISLPFILITIAFWVLSVAVVARVFGEVLRITILQNTPLGVTVGTLILVSVIIATTAPGVVARFNELVIPLYLITIVLMGYSAFEHGEMINLLPLFQVNGSAFLKGIMVALFAFAGYELTLQTAGYYQDSSQAFRIHSIGITVITLIYSYVFLTTLSVFGVDEIQNLTYPVLEMVKETRSAFILVERLESAFLAIWVINVYISMSNTYFSVVSATIQFFQLKEKNRIKVAWVLAPIIFVIAILPQNIATVYQWIDQYTWVSSIYFAAFIVILAFIALIRNKKGEQSPSVQSTSKQTSQ